MTLKEYFKISIPRIGIYSEKTFYYRIAEISGIKTIIPDSFRLELYLDTDEEFYPHIFQNIGQSIPKSLEEEKRSISRVRFITKRKKYIFNTEKELDIAVSSNNDLLRLYAASQYSEITWRNRSMGPLLDVAVFIPDDEYGNGGGFFDNFIMIPLKDHNEFMKRISMN